MRAGAAPGAKQIVPRAKTSMAKFNQDASLEQSHGELPAPPALGVWEARVIANPRTN